MSPIGGNNQKNIPFQIPRGLPDIPKEVNFKLNLKPQQDAISLTDYINHYSRYSIAIDGYVDHPVYENFDIPIANYDHHSGCDRLSTRATCGQIWMAIRGGLFDVFKDSTSARVEVHSNGNDEDNCAAIVQLEEPHLVLADKDQRFEHLIDAFDKLDTTLGTYSLPLDSELFQSVFWITDPYREFRNSKKYNTREVNECLDVIDQVKKRIKRYLNKTHRLLQPDTRYEIIGGGKNWVMINDVGKQSRLGAMSDGHRAILSVRPLPNGNHAFVFARASNYIVHFDLPKFTSILNLIENNYEYFSGNINLISSLSSIPSQLKNNQNGLWGGGNLVLGSPRDSGSKIPPEFLEHIINSMIDSRDLPLEKQLYLVSSYYQNAQRQKQLQE